MRLHRHWDAMFALSRLSNQQSAPTQCSELCKGHKKEEAWCRPSKHHQKWKCREVPPSSSLKSGLRNGGWWSQKGFTGQVGHWPFLGAPEECRSVTAVPGGMITEETKCEEQPGLSEKWWEFCPTEAEAPAGECWVIKKTAKPRPHSGKPRELGNCLKLVYFNPAVQPQTWLGKMLQKILPWVVFF